MTVITLSRQFGSGGDRIAEQVAHRLGLRLVGREVLNQAARQGGVPDVALAEIDELGLLGLKPRRQDREVYRQTVDRLIVDWAEAGSVLLVGRGSHLVLAGRPGVLRVRINAPKPLRIRYVAEHCNVPEEIARELVEARDRARAQHVQRYFGVMWGAAEQFDMVLNMERLSEALAADLICQAAEALKAQEPR